MRAWRAALWAVILLTWTSLDPTQLVYIEKRPQGERGFTTVAVVPGQHYLDYYVEGATCYRARYWNGFEWTKEGCAGVNQTLAMPLPTPTVAPTPTPGGN